MKQLVSLCLHPELPGYNPGVNFSARITNPVDLSDYYDTLLNSQYTFTIPGSYRHIREYV
ncbi:MAG TPA: hypothetical protein VI230_08505 [Ignavibacteriaceae bacterium]